MTELEAFNWWKTEQDEAGYKQSEIARLAWLAACKWQRDECIADCMATHADAQEAAKAKDATTYEAGYQDAAIDCVETIQMRSEA